MNFAHLMRLCGHSLKSLIKLISPKRVQEEYLKKAFYDALVIILVHEIFFLCFSSLDLISFKVCI